MRQYIKEIGSNSIIYTIATILTRAVGILLIPIYARYLTQEDYGIISIITPLVTVVLALFDFGMRSTLNRFFFDYPNNSFEQKNAVGNIVMLSATISLFMLALLLIFGSFLFSYLFPNIDFYPFVFYAITTAFFLLFFELKLNLLKVQKKAIQFGIYSFLKFLLIVVSTIILVVYYQKGAMGKIISEFVVTAIFSVFAIIVLISELKFKPDKKLIKEVFRFALPIVPYALSGIITGFTGRYFVNYYQGLETTAVFNIGFLIGSFMQMVVMSINSAWTPFFNQKAQENKEDTLITFSKLTTYYTLTILFLSLIIIFFSEEAILLLATKKYLGGLKIVPIIVISYLLNGLYFMFAVKIFYVKTANKFLARMNIIAAIINIIICFILIPKFGIVGAAWTSLIYFAIIAVSAFFISQKTYYIPYEYPRLLLLFITWGVFFGLYFVIRLFSFSIIQGIAIKLGLIILFLLSLYWFKFMRKSEIDNIKDIIRKVKIRYTK